MGTKERAQPQDQFHPQVWKLTWTLSQDPRPPLQQGHPRTGVVSKWGPSDTWIWPPGKADLASHWPQPQPAEEWFSSYRAKWPLFAAGCCSHSLLAILEGFFLQERSWNLNSLEGWALENMKCFYKKIQHQDYDLHQVISCGLDFLFFPSKKHHSEICRL